MDSVADELRATWQSRMLRTTQREPIGAVVLSMMAHAYDADGVLPLLQVTFPGFQSIKPPFIASAAKIDKSGHVVADYVDQQERVRKDEVIYRRLTELQDECRCLADRMKLSDQERLEFFTVVKRWVVADRRLDPTMNPADPDARRLVH